MIYIFVLINFLTNYQCFVIASVTSSYLFIVMLLAASENR